MSDIQNEISRLEYDSSEFDKMLVLGQQVYNVLLYSYLFLNVGQDSSIIGQLRKIPKEKLLKLYIKEMQSLNIWDSQEYGIVSKIRRSFAILGLHYKTLGYESAYSIFKAAVHPFFDDFFKLPITNYTHLLKSYAWSYYHINISCTVTEEKRFSNKDVIFKASISFLGTQYYEIGYSKKNAIENLSMLVVKKAIPDTQLRQITRSQNYAPIQRNEFIFDESDYQDPDEKVRTFSEKYGVEQSLMRFALLRSSQMGKNIPTKLLDSFHIFTDIKSSHLKKSLMRLGQEFILLQILDRALKNNEMQMVNFSSLDQTALNTGVSEVHKQLQNMLSTTDLLIYIFEHTNVPVSDSLTDKEKLQIESCIIAVFFLSNFSPDKKSEQCFGELFNSFYQDRGINAEIDYRYEVISYLSALSALDTKFNTNHHESDNGIFHAEVLIDDSSNVLSYVCENESMSIAKKEVWKSAYENIIYQVQNFFISPDSKCSDNVLMLFVKGVVKSKVTSHSFFSKFGILNAKNVNTISLTSFSKIVDRLKAYLPESLIVEFIKNVCDANKGLYIQIDNHIYSYSDWFSSLVLKSKSCQSIDECAITEIYENIVNPSIAIQKKLIDKDYKFVSRIYPISDDVAKYSIQLNLDSYNYLRFISQNVKEYFEKLREEREQILDIGELSSDINDNINITIMDSHRPFNLQIEQLIEHLDIQRVIIACGYCFSSGLSMISDTIKQIMDAKIPFELYIGALQAYDESMKENIITGIDKATIKVLNNYLTNSNFNLFTCAERFYHGKIYIFEGVDESIVCMGSSNISRSAFINNYELNMAFKMPTSSSMFSNFMLWAKQLKYNSREIKYLDESRFGDNEIKLDGSVLLKRITLSSMKEKINELSNAEIQYRLTLWLSYSPDIIAEDLGIMSLPNYFIFVYTSEKLIVFESFEAGNAYFCVRYDNSYEDVINNIATFSKSEIFEFSKMTKRGYHVSNKFTLENNIRQFFKKEVRK